MNDTKPYKATECTTFQWCLSKGLLTRIKTIRACDHWSHLFHFFVVFLSIFRGTLPWRFYDLDVSLLFPVMREKNMKQNLINQTMTFRLITSEWKCSRIEFVAWHFVLGMSWSSNESNVEIHRWTLSLRYMRRVYVTSISISMPDCLTLLIRSVECVRAVFLILASSCA